MLTIIHAEHGHGLITETLVDMISEAMQRYDDVLYLSWTGEYNHHRRPSPFSGLRTIPLTASFEQQFLEAKIAILESQPDKVELCGISYDICVREFRDLLMGRADIGPYGIVGKTLGYSSHQFDALFKERVKVRVKKNLTDANPLFYGH